MSESPQKRNIEQYISRIRSRQSGRNDIERLYQGIADGSRSALSEGITLVESRHPDDLNAAHQLLKRCLPPARSKRIGITGTPGVGKSTFINSYARQLADAGHSTAILSVDPSSYLSRGSILGDKTRMTDLTDMDNVYIRPSATGQTLGGVHERTRESILLCEAAGYTHIIVETVGVGQSEYFVQRMTDLMVLMLLPGSGDELQGIKKGIMEAADIVLVNKDDLFPSTTVNQSISDYRNALSQAVRPNNDRKARILSGNSMDPDSVGNVAEEIDAYFSQAMDSGSYDRKREEQWKLWFTDSLGWSVQEMIRSNQKAMRPHWPSSDQLPPAAAYSWVKELFHGSGS